MSNHMYIDLDSIIDTRLPILYSIDKELVKDEVSSNRYFYRITDNFKYLGHKVFRKIYSKRNKMVLRNPLVTDMVGILLDYTLKAKMVSMETKIDENMDIYLNIYPYKLSEYEIGVMIDNISNFLPSFTKLHIINMNTKEVDIDYVIRHFKLLVMYEGMKWLQYHLDVGELKYKSIPNVLLLVPKLVENKNIIKRQEINNFFLDIKDKVKIYIDLDFLDVGYFCVMKKGK